MEETFKKERTLTDAIAQKQLSRRKFMSYAGALGVTATAIGVASCNKNDNDDGVDLGSGDTGILNYAYALEQLEAAFYINVVAAPYAGITATEVLFLTDIRDHEIAHREFLKAALGSKAIVALEMDFTTVNFTNRDSVLNTAKAFEDLGVSAYNGAGYLIADANNLLMAGKIVSVEARHSALIRELIGANLFLGDQVDDNSVNIVRTPNEVLIIADTYFTTKINASNLPTA